MAFPPRGSTRVRVAAALAMVFAAAPSWPQSPAGGQALYFKQFYVDEVLTNDNPVIAGSLIQTWSDSKNPDVLVENKVVRTGPPAVGVSFFHSREKLTSQDMGNKGLPIQPTGTSTSEDYFSLVQSNDAYGHSVASSAGALVKVARKAPGPQQIMLDNRQLRTLRNYVRIDLQGEAFAGIPKDGDASHSANSMAAAEVRGLQKYRVIDPTQRIPVVSIFGQNLMIGRETASIGPDGKHFARGLLTDPYYVSLLDEDTGVELTEQVATETMDYNRAAISVGDDGIRLQINRNDPESYVDFAFDSRLSSWVLNPYFYGARLDRNGFAAFGLLSLGWTVSMTSDFVDAFYAFGPGGAPFDHIDVQPDIAPSQSHTYSYGIGLDGGASVAVSVPEPSAVSVLALCGCVLAAAAKRRT